MEYTGSSRFSQYFVYALIARIFCRIYHSAFSNVSNSLNPWYSISGFLPRGFHIENYKFATTMIDFWNYLKNTVIICAISVATTTLSSGLVGYAFSRIQAPGKKFLFMIVLSTMMVPGIVTQIPTFILFNKVWFAQYVLPLVVLGSWRFGIIYIFIQTILFSDSQGTGGSGKDRWLLNLPYVLEYFSSTFIACHGDCFDHELPSYMGRFYRSLHVSERIQIPSGHCVRDYWL